jgi:hypothetical protein
MSFFLAVLFGGRLYLGYTYFNWGKDTHARPLIQGVEELYGGVNQLLNLISSDFAYGRF